MPFQPLQQGQQPSSGFKPMQQGQQPTQGMQPMSKDQIRSYFQGPKNVGKQVGTSLSSFFSGEKPFEGRQTEQSRQALQQMRSPMLPGGDRPIPTTGLAGMATAPFRALGTGFQTAASGVGDIAYGASQVGQGLHEGLTGQFGEGKAGQRMLAGTFGRMIPGALQTVASPIAGALSVAPEPVQQTVGGVGKALSYIPEQVTKGMGLDPESDIGRGIMGATSLIQDVGLFGAGKGLRSAAKTKTGRAAIGAGKRFGQDVGLGAKVIGKTLGRKASDFGNLLFPAKHVDDVVGKIIQSKTTKDIRTAAKGLDQMDLSKVRSYSDLTDNANNTASALQSQKKNILRSYDDTLHKLDDLKTIIKEKGVTVRQNFVKNALEQLEDFHIKTNNPAGAELAKRALEKARKTGLTLNEIDDVAIEYGKNISGLKSFTQTGKLKHGISSQAVENIRRGVKKYTRDMMPDDAARVLDEKVSSVLTVRSLADKMQESVQNLANKVDERNLLQKISNKVGKSINVATFGAPRELFNSLFMISDVGGKSRNALALQSMLKSNIKTFTKLTKQLEKAKDANKIRLLGDKISNLLSRNLKKKGVEKGTLGVRATKEFRKSAKEKSKEAITSGEGNNE